jgi:hypothetical protein
MLRKRNTKSAITADPSNDKIAAVHIEAATTKASAKGATTTFLRRLELHQNQEEGEHQARRGSAGGSDQRVFQDDAGLRSYSFSGPRGESAAQCTPRGCVRADARRNKNLSGPVRALSGSRSQRRRSRRAPRR